MQTFVLKKQKTTITKHALGTILGVKVSQNLYKVDELIALDPVFVFYQKCSVKLLNWSYFKIKFTLKSIL